MSVRRRIKRDRDRPRHPLAQEVREARLYGPPPDQSMVKLGPGDPVPASWWHQPLADRVYK